MLKSRKRHRSRRRVRRKSVRSLRRMFRRRSSSRRHKKKKSSLSSLSVIPFVPAPQPKKPFVDRRIYVTIPQFVINEQMIKHYGPMYHQLYLEGFIDDPYNKIQKNERGIPDEEGQKILRENDDNKMLYFRNLDVRRRKEPADPFFDITSDDAKTWPHVVPYILPRESGIPNATPDGKICANLCFMNSLLHYMYPVILMSEYCTLNPRIRNVTFVDERKNRSQTPIQLFFRWSQFGEGVSAFFREILSEATSVERKKVMQQNLLDIANASVVTSVEDGEDGSINAIVHVQDRGTVYGGKEDAIQMGAQEEIDVLFVKLVENFKGLGLRFDRTIEGIKQGIVSLRLEKKDVADPLNITRDEITKSLDVKVGRMDKEVDKFFANEDMYDVSSMFQQMMMYKTHVTEDDLYNVQQISVLNVNDGMPMYVHMLVEPKNDSGFDRYGRWRLKSINKYFPKEIGQAIEIAHPYFFADNEKYKSEYVYRICDIVCRGGDASGGHYVSCGLRQIPGTNREGWYFYSDTYVSPQAMSASQMLEQLRKSRYVPRAYLFRLQTINPPEDMHPFTFENINITKERHVETLSYIRGDEISEPIVLIKPPEPTKPEPDNLDELHAKQGPQEKPESADNVFGRRRVMSRTDFVREYCNRKRCSKDHALKKYWKAMSAL
jgi:hypothetical protein